MSSPVASSAGSPHHRHARWHHELEAGGGGIRTNLHGCSTRPAHVAVRGESFVLTCSLPLLPYAFLNSAPHTSPTLPPCPSPWEGGARSRVEEAGDVVGVRIVITTAFLCATGTRRAKQIALTGGGGGDEEEVVMLV